jgi:ABC-type multidrug transport system permease subunit
VDEETGLGGRFWFMVALACVGSVVAAGLVFVLFGRAWERWGFFGAFLALGAVLMVFGWAYDRRDRKRRQRLIA